MSSLYFKLRQGEHEKSFITSGALSGVESRASPVFLDEAINREPFSLRPQGTADQCLCFAT